MPTDNAHSKHAVLMYKYVTSKCMILMTSLNQCNNTCRSDFYNILVMFGIYQLSIIHGYTLTHSLLSDNNAISMTSQDVITT